MYGDPAEEILRYASQANADLIVMPTHGPTHAGRGFGRLLDDSVATRVMRKARRPVLLARAEVGRTVRVGRQEESNEESAAIRSEEVFVA